MNGIYVFSVYMKANSHEVSWYSSLSSEDHWELIKYPLIVGKRWTWNLSGSTRTAVVQAEESQTVPAGTFFNCMKVEYYDGTTLIETIWFASNVGIVRDYDPGNCDLQLQDYNNPN